jgi:hypothetical protein
VRVVVFSRGKPGHGSIWPVEENGCPLRAWAWWEESSSSEVIDRLRDLGHMMTGVFASCCAQLAGVWR